MYTRHERDKSEKRWLLNAYFAFGDKLKTMWLRFEAVEFNVKEIAIVSGISIHCAITRHRLINPDIMPH
jgi:hypothetical protein